MRTKHAARRPRYQPRVETLEDRRLLSAVALQGSHGHHAVPAVAHAAAAATADSGMQPSQFGSEAALKEYLINLAVQEYSWYFGQPYYGYYGYGFPGRLYGDVTLSALSSGATASSTNTTSQTNTQVQGVDEGDTVKTDGQYLYLLSHGKLVILNAWPADQLQSVSVTTLPGNPLVEYLNGNHLTVISQDYQQNDGWGGGNGGGPIVYLRPVFFWSHPMVDVTVYDVSNPSAPTVVQQNQLDGNYDNSRAIGGTVYVALNSYLNLPMPEYTSGWGSQVYESEAAYRARLEALPLDGLLPHYTTQWNDANGAQTATGLLTTAADIYQPANPGALNLMSLVAFDGTGAAVGPMHSVSLLTDYNATLYATAHNFYLFTDQWSETGSSTLIDKLSLQDGNIQFTAAGQVPGTIINQFSVGENGAYLDVATTTAWGNDASNNVYVLAESDHTLNIVGRLEGLASGERIYSVWFMGDRGFVSTYRQVDPLFAIDLSDPTAPRVAGQLEVSGYTGYLQPLDATHLLGIGRDGGNLVISLFDVSDLSHPALVSRYDVAPSGWAWSQAEYDYHAITYYPQFQALTLPVSSYEYIPAPDGSDGQWIYQTDQLVFHVDLASGALALQGTINDTSSIGRGVFINNVLYSISDTSVQAHSLDDLNTLIAQAQLPAPENSYYWWWGGGPIVLRTLGIDVIQVSVVGKVGNGGLPNSGSTGSTGATDPSTGSSPTGPTIQAQPSGQPIGSTDLANIHGVVQGLSSAGVQQVFRAQSPGQNATAGEQVRSAATMAPISLQDSTTSQTSGGGQREDLTQPLIPVDSGETQPLKIEDEQGGGDTAALEGPAVEGVWSDLAPRMVDAVFSGQDDAADTPLWGVTAAFLLAADASASFVAVRRTAPAGGRRPRSSGSRG